MQTPLAQLMNLTKTTAKQISDATGINATLLSKFKTGQRKLIYNSNHPQLLADYFLQCRAEQAGQVVRNFLLELNPGLEDADISKLRENLCLWLTTIPDIKPSHDNASPNVLIFQDINDLKSIMDDFINTVLSSGEKSITITHDFPDLQISTSILDFLLPYLMKLKDRGCQIRILDNCPAPKTYMGIHNWMDLYFSDQVEFYSNHDHHHLYRAILSVDNVCSLVILSNDAGQKIYHSTLYKDTNSANYFHRTSALEFESSIKSIEKHPLSNVMDYLHSLDRYLTPTDTTYLINPVVMYKTMRADILTQVLRENGIPESQWNNAFETNEFTAYLRTKCPYKQIYNLSAMKALASMEYTIDGGLAEIYERPIKVSRRLMHEHLKHLSEINTPDDYQVLFVPFENLYLLHATTSYVVQNNSFFSAWDPSRSLQRICSRDKQLACAAYSYMEEIWNSIPAEYLSEEWQNAQLQHLLDISKC